MDSVELVGWVGAIFLVICGLPQLHTTIKTKTTEGLSLGMLITWWLGLIFTGTYVLLTSKNLPLLFNYWFNAVVVFIILWKYFEYRD